MNLCLDKQPTDYYTPVCHWGLHPSRGCGTLLFYEFPFLNEQLLKHQELLQGVTTYSIGEIYLESDPEESKRWIMGQIRKKRALSRRFQQMGIPVWIDLSIRPDCANLAFYGVPDGWQCYTIRKPTTKELLRMAELAQQKAGSDIHLIVYGGDSIVQKICKERGWHFEPEYTYTPKPLPNKNNPLRKGLQPLPLTDVTDGKKQLITILTR